LRSPRFEHHVGVAGLSPPRNHRLRRRDYGAGFICNGAFNVEEDLLRQKRRLKKVWASSVQLGVAAQAFFYFSS